MGEVYKLKDLKLDRIVAGKIVRRDRRDGAASPAFLQEARAMALFSDRRIVRIFEFRDGDPALIVMEHVEGFELGRIGPSLEFAQRARVLAEVCDAVHHAHGLGIQHRDLKPSNIMVDAALLPRILDFGLSAGDPRKGHLKGTVRYIAPEQLDPSQPIDARTDVYALGVILYELLAGRPPYEGGSDQEIVDAIRAGAAAAADRDRSAHSRAAPGDRAEGHGDGSPVSGTRPRRTWRSICAGSSPAVRCSRARRSTRRHSGAAPAPISSTSPSGCSSG